MSLIKMPRKKYKIVRRGQKYCVRVKGTVNTTETFHFCRERKMSYHIKQYWTMSRPRIVFDWDYDFIFDKEYEATAFIMGCII